MSLYASADLLAACKLYARRPAVDQAMPNESWYSFLTLAQGEVYPALFSRFPDLAYSTARQMTTDDGGYTYTFGVDADDAGNNPPNPGGVNSVRPMGHAEIFPDVRSIPDSPLVIGADYLFEGSLIRIPNSEPRLFPQGPWARFVVRPDTPISASVQPLLQPKNLRMLLVWKALESWASRPGSGASPIYYAKRYEDALQAAFVELATTYNRQASAGATATDRWHTALDLADTGFLNT